MASLPHILAQSVPYTIMGTISPALIFEDRILLLFLKHDSCQTSAKDCL